MDRPLVEEILSSLEHLNILELKTLADALSEKYMSFTVVDEAELRARKAREEAYWTPWYALILVRVNCRPEDKVTLIKKIRELNCCGLKEGKELVENPEKLPFVLVKKYDYPPDVRRSLQPIREEMEKLGAEFDEDYNYGYFD